MVKLGRLDMPSHLCHNWLKGLLGERMEACVANETSAVSNETRVMETGPRTEDH